MPAPWGKRDALADWRRRMDRVLVVTSPDELKIARFAARVSPEEGRAAAEASARQRLQHQIPDAEKAARADYVIENAGELKSLRAQVVTLWPRLQADSNKIPAKESLE
jgi:dephospho-CoA kinase